MDYQIVIKESVEELRKLEKAVKDLKRCDRVRFLRLLKTGRPAHVGTGAEAVEEFKKTPELVERYEKCVYWGDEMRYGTRTELKRR